jgi:hypothetical protein
MFIEELFVFVLGLEKRLDHCRPICQFYLLAGNY